MFEKVNVHKPSGRFVASWLACSIGRHQVSLPLAAGTRRFLFWTSSQWCVYDSFPCQDLDSREDLALDSHMF